MIINRRTALGGILAAPVAIGTLMEHASAEEAPENLARMMDFKLTRLGVEVLERDDANTHPGVKIGMAPTHGGAWTQRNVDGPNESFDAEVAISLLAGNIAHNFRRVRFGFLFMPSRGVQEVQRHYFNDVVLREIAALTPSVDEHGFLVERLFRRIDVLFVGEGRSA
jgi:hypothetical protein